MSHHNPHIKFLFFTRLLVVVIHLWLAWRPSFAISEADILLKFRESLNNAIALSNWNPSRGPPCEGLRSNWDGVMCENRGRVLGLNLNGKGLGGDLDVVALTELTSLRVFGAMNNSFEGPLPSFKKLGSLKHLYLSHNKFSGEIKSNEFEGMNSLKKLHLAGNSFVGPIPGSLATLGKLVELMLENNKFDGKIPDFKQERFTLVNLSNNLLEGQIPVALSHLNASSFAGNIGLCGLPLKPCVSNPKLPTSTIVIVGISLAAALVAIVAVIVILTSRKRFPAPEEGASISQATGLRTVPLDELDKTEKGSTAASSSPEFPMMSPEGRKPEPSLKLTFLVDSGERFDLADLLNASAEMLGSGVFGSTYKAALGPGSTMVVKRFKHMNNVGKEDFHEHMRRLGRLTNHNLLSTVAFYYRKEEKLLVSHFAPNMSLAFHLHGNSKCEVRSGSKLDWPTRLRIVKGVARGLSYLYTELPSLTAPHGHLKSTNVLLNASFEPLLNDYGLLPVVNLEHAQKHMIAYKSPEYRQGKRITKKTDVWALGILILEILTGKYSENYFLQQGKAGIDSDLATWVESVMSDGSVEEVFDKDMVVNGGCDQEMRMLLKIGMSCCEADVEKRWDIKEAMKSIEE
ncbi:unnamed protein product, partial [Cuscuta epithymum]